jgi:hypothetical protein
MANPAAGANLAQALTDHERLKRSTDMPLYFGRKEKDTITARHLIERIEKGAVIAAWDAARKCNELYMLLRDKAMVWYESLVDEELDLQDWDVVKREFLKTYEPKYSARTTCANFSDLVQKPGETINDFHVRVQTAYKRITDSKPATMATVRLAGATPDQAKLEGMKDMAKFFKHQLFLAGLSDNLRDKVLEAKKDTFTESLDLARELESIQLDHRRSQKIAAVKAELQPEEASTIAWESLTEEEVEQVAAIRAKNNRFQPKRTFAAPQGRSNGPRNQNVVCRYCKKKGHMQKECRSRQRDKAPMVDANGKAYDNRVNNVAEEGAKPEQEYEDPHVGAVANLSPYHHLNW